MTTEINESGLPQSDQFSTPPESRTPESERNDEATMNGIVPPLNFADGESDLSDGEGLFDDTFKETSVYKKNLPKYCKELDFDFSEIKRKNEQALLESQAAVKQLSSTLGELKQHANRNKQIMSQRVEQLKVMKKEVEEICQKTADELIPARDVLEESLKVNAELVEKMNQLMLNQEGAGSTEQELEQQLSLLEECTGLQIGGLKGNRIQIMFKHLHEQFPDKEMGIVLKVEDQVYKDEIDELTEKLRATNNLQKFVYELRKAFKDKLTKETANGTGEPSVA